MKTFKLVPFVLAGFCGYLHTVIKTQFQVSDVLTDQRQIQRNMIHMPRLSDELQKEGSAPFSSRLSSFKASSSSSSSSISPSSTTTTATTNTQLSSLSSISLLRHASMEDFIKAVPEYIKGQEESGPRYEPPEKDRRVAAISEEYQTALLQYTLDLLPHDHSSGGGSSEAGAKEGESQDTQIPKAYEYGHVDIMVPASGQDDRLRVFADHLGIALKHFQEWYDTERQPALLQAWKLEQEKKVAQDKALPDLYLTFRLLVTRYPQDEQTTDEEIDEFRQELAERTGLPLEKVVLVRVGHNSEEEDADDDTAEDVPQLQFNRAHARNVLHQNACGEETCIATSLDVDMQVLPVFFHRALQSAKPGLQAYFPIVFSEFNPQTVQLVQDFLYPPIDRKKDDNEASKVEPALLPPFSKHRGLWRDFGFGMYALSGPDIKRFHFNEDFQGWGHEDNDFYKLVHNRLRVDRQHEHGLIHQWHPKDCSIGKDIITEQQWTDCLNSRDVMEGSALGLLLRKPLPSRSAGGFAAAKKAADAKMSASGIVRKTKTKKRMRRGGAAPQKKKKGNK